MLLLSALRRFAVCDRDGRRARLDDLSIGDGRGDHPAVTRLVLRDGRQRSTLAAARIHSINAGRRSIEVDDLSQAEESERGALDAEVLLVRDVLDALVLDLQYRRATRANDLCLVDDGPRLVLAGVDASAIALLRRLVRGRGTRCGRDALDWRYVEFLRGRPLEARRFAVSGHRIARLPPGEIATLSAALPYSHAAELVALLEDRLGAAVLAAMDDDRAVQVFEELGPGHGERLLDEMPADAVADLLGRLLTHDARTAIERLRDDRRELVLELLKYPVDSAGGIMTNEVAAVPATLDARGAVEWLRRTLGRTSFSFIVYAVEQEGSSRLVGALPLSELLLAPDEARVADLMNPFVATLGPLEPASAASRRLLDAHLAALPVTGPGGDLLGAVSLDAALAWAVPAAGPGTIRVFA